MDNGTLAYRLLGGYAYWTLLMAGTMFDAASERPVRQWHQLPVRSIPPATAGNARVHVLADASQVRPLLNQSAM